MKIRTITCHDVYNHGASLQAYALQTYLESLGHDVKIIDYKPSYLCGHYDLWKISNSQFDKPLLKQLYLLIKFPHRMISLRRKHAFDAFTRKYLHLTTRSYHFKEELKKNPPEADAYIAGSDQIWNTLFPNGKDSSFYLDFAPKGKLRIAYAASFATKEIAEGYEGFVSQMLKNINFVSIRESISLPLLASLGRTDGVAVCDPVFLLSKQEWKAIMPPSTSEKYLLVYDTENSSTLASIAISIARDLKLPIYDVSNFRHTYAQKKMWNSSPTEFLSLLYGANFVVSNSFHATAFSIIFERDFCVVNRSEKINERMKSLLHDFGLSERQVKTYSFHITNHIDYHNITPVLEKKIISSKLFLSNALKIK